MVSPDLFRCLGPDSSHPASSAVCLGSVPRATAPIRGLTPMTVRGAEM